MHKLIAMIGLLLVALLAACAPAVTGEPTVESEPEETPAPGGSALNPALGDDSDDVLGDETGYPVAPSESAASGYPGLDEASLLPEEAYPGSTLVSPVEVDLSQLTPVAGNPKGHYVNLSERQHARARSALRRPAPGGHDA